MHGQNQTKFKTEAGTRGFLSLHHLILFLIIDFVLMTVEKNKVI